MGRGVRSSPDSRPRRPGHAGNKLRSGSTGWRENFRPTASFSLRSYRKLTPTFRRAFAGRIEIVTGTIPRAGTCLRLSQTGGNRRGPNRRRRCRARGGTLAPAIIVSCGTATAFTVLDGTGRLCGGAIAPGLQTQLRRASRCHGATARHDIKIAPIRLWPSRPGTPFAPESC